MTLRLTENQLDSRFPYSLYGRIWRYENKLVLRYFDLGKTTYFFFCKNGPHYEFIIKTRDFDFGREISENIWDPKAEPQQYSLKNMLLNHIDGMLSSMVKRGKLNQINKFDFSSVYYGKGEWHAYYPSLEDLIEYHLSLPEQVDEYLTYLRSDELKAQRDEWDKEPTIVVPQ